MIVLGKLLSLTLSLWESQKNQYEEEDWCRYQVDITHPCVATSLLTILYNPGNQSPIQPFVTSLRALESQGPQGQCCYGYSNYRREYYEPGA